MNLNLNSTISPTGKFNQFKINLMKGMNEEEMKAARYNNSTLSTKNSHANQGKLQPLTLSNFNQKRPTNVKNLQPISAMGSKPTGAALDSSPSRNLNRPSDQSIRGTNQ